MLPGKYDSVLYLWPLAVQLCEFSRINASEGSEAGMPKAALS